MTEIESIEKTSNILRNLRSSIIADIKKLRKLEQQIERTKVPAKGVIPRKRRTMLPADFEGQTVELRETIYENQRHFLSLQAELEREISKVPDPYTRLAMSLYYAELMTYRETAAAIGCGISSGAVQRLFDRRKERQAYDGS